MVGQVPRRLTVTRFVNFSGRFYPLGRFFIGLGDEAA